VTVVTRRPSGPLGGLVTAVTYRAGEQPRTSVEKILPGPETGLWVNLNRDAFRSFGWSGGGREVPGAMVSGPASRAAVMEFEEGHGHVAVSFALGAAHSFFGVPVSVLRDDLVPLPELWGRAGACLRERVLEAATPVAALAAVEEVLRSSLTGPGPDPAVIAAAGALNRGVAVGEVADRLGLLPRTLRRRFSAQVGLTPKRFARIQRLKRVARDLDGHSSADWAAVAARHGYADQPHLAGEFRELAGVTPTGYLRSRVNGPNHLRFSEVLCTRIRSPAAPVPATWCGSRLRNQFSRLACSWTWSPRGCRLPTCCRPGGSTR
jgi:AraC-like DNA-binding protein